MIDGNTTITFTPRTPEEIYKRESQDKRLKRGAVCRVYWSTVMEAHCVVWSKKPNDFTVERLGLQLVLERVLVRKLTLVEKETNESSA